MYDVFLICPVRIATEDQKKALIEHVKAIEEQDKKIYYPEAHTDQNDATGLRICSDNMQAIASSKEVHVFWDPKSQGSLFDLGVAFALGKPIKIINKGSFNPTLGKSFSNMILAWEENCEKSLKEIE